MPTLMGPTNHVSFLVYLLLAVGLGFCEYLRRYWQKEINFGNLALSSKNENWGPTMFYGLSSHMIDLRLLEI